MTRVHDLIKPKIANNPEDILEWSLEWQSVGLRHPAERQWQTIKTIMPSAVAVTILLLIIAINTDHISCWLFFVAGCIHIFSLVSLGLRDNYQMKLMLPHVFVGYNFRSDGQEKKHDNLLYSAIEVSPFVAFLSAFVWPTWGVVSVIPPNIQDKFTAVRENLGFRGASWPFCLRVMTDDKWTIAVEKVLERCKLAVFDTRETVGEGLQWEINTAKRILGDSRVAFIASGDNGKPILIVNNVVYSTPDETQKLESINVDVEYFFDVLCATRKWISDHIAIDRYSLNKRENFSKFDSVMAKITTSALYCLPIVIIGGVVMAIKTLIE